MRQPVVNMGSTLAHKHHLHKPGGCNILLYHLYHYHIDSYCILWFPNDHELVVTFQYLPHVPVLLESLECEKTPGSACSRPLLLGLLNGFLLLKGRNLTGFVGIQVSPPSSCILATNTKKTLQNFTTTLTDTDRVKATPQVLPEKPVRTYATVWSQHLFKPLNILKHPWTSLNRADQELWHKIFFEVSDEIGGSTVPGSTNKLPAFFHLQNVRRCQKSSSWQWFQWALDLIQKEGPAVGVPLRVLEANEKHQLRLRLTMANVWLTYAALSHSSVLIEDLAIGATNISSDQGPEILRFTTRTALQTSSRRPI